MGGQFIGRRSRKPHLRNAQAGYCSNGSLTIAMLPIDQASWQRLETKSESPPLILANFGARCDHTPPAISNSTRPHRCAFSAKTRGNAPARALHRWETATDALPGCGRALPSAAVCIRCSSSYPAVVRHTPPAALRSAAAFSAKTSKNAVRTCATSASISSHRGWRGSCSPLSAQRSTTPTAPAAPRSGRPGSRGSGGRARQAGRWLSSGG